jgi:8-oxo-dGTP pyrophosphatase MutT (NUDIX family)
MAKDANSKSPRPKLPVRREVSAGGLVYRRRRDDRLEFVLIRPKGADTWALPKGHIEKGESAEDAAVREVREETGLEVGHIEPLGDVSYVFSWRDQPQAPLVRIFKRVRFFTMEFAGGDSNAHDGEIEEVAWYEAEEASQRASYKDERSLIGKAISLLSRRATGGAA